MHRNYAQSIDAIQVALRDASKPHGVHVRADHGGCTCHRPPTPLAVSGTSVVCSDADMTDSAVAPPNHGPCSQSPLDIVKRDSPGPPPSSTVSGEGTPALRYSP